jgi:hypothetical protein
MIEGLSGHTDNRPNERPNNGLFTGLSGYPASRMIDRVVGCSIIKTVSHSNIKTFKRPAIQTADRLAPYAAVQPIVRLFK